MNQNSEKLQSPEKSLDGLPSSQANISIERGIVDLDLLVARSAEERNRSFLRKVSASAGASFSAVLAAIFGVVVNIYSSSISLSSQFIWILFAGLVFLSSLVAAFLGRFSFGRHPLGRSFADVSDPELRTMVKAIAVGQVEFMSTLTESRVLGAGERNDG